MFPSCIFNFSDADHGISLVSVMSIWFEMISLVCGATEVCLVARFQQNMATYQNLITQSMYDKQLDSGRGTLLHLCDDVIQQEVSKINL